MFLPEFLRMSRVSLHIHSDQLQKGIISFSAHLQSKKCNTKLYMIPTGTIYGRFESRLSATAGSLDIDGTRQGNHVSPDVWGPKDYQRSVFDVSAKTLDNDLVIKLEELFEEVKTMVKMGDKNDALDLLEANYGAVKEHLDTGSRGIEEAAILDVVALGYMVIQDFKMVGSLLDMLNEVVNGLKDDEPLLDLVLIHMGSMYSTLGKSEKSILVYRRGLEITERNYGSNSTFLVTPLLGMGKVLSSIGRATKAIEIYQRVITILESNKGAESEELVVPLFSLGNLLIKEGKAADAENHFTRILNLYMKQYGERDERVAMAMRALANVKCAKGEMEEAVQLCRNAIQVLKGSCTRLDDNKLEKMRIDLAELLHAVGRGNEGRVVLEECLLINERYRGKEHPSSVTNLINLATSYSRSKNYVESERLLRTSLQILSKSVGPDDQSLSFPMLHLAITLYNLKKHVEAEQLALKVLRIREKAFGKESVPVGEALDCLVSIQSRLEREDSVLLKRLKRVLRIQEKAFGPNSKEVIETLKKVVFYMDKLGRKDEKLPLQKRLSVLINIYKDTAQY
ncbi:hypothetical protein LguiB_027777 [Lonicera macranthoides]